MDELKRFFRSRWAELLIAGVWLQSVISAVFSGNLVLLAITTLGGLALLAVIFWLAGWWRRRRLPVFEESEAYTVQRQAVIFTVGWPKEPIVFGLEGQKPAWVGLICSRQTESTADAIRDECGLPEDQIQKEIVDPWSIGEVRQKTAFLLDWLVAHGVAESQIAVDITGGTAIMSAGAFSLASERMIDSQYTRSDYDEENRPIQGTQRGVFVARYLQKG